jgi:hypothetical protein
LLEQRIREGPVRRAAISSSRPGVRGALVVELRSHSDNPSGANDLYRKMGFVKSET